MSYNRGIRSGLRQRDEIPARKCSFAYFSQRGATRVQPPPGFVILLRVQLVGLVDVQLPGVRFLDKGSLRRGQPGRQQERGTHLDFDHTSNKTHIQVVLRDFWDKTKANVLYLF